MWNGINNLSQCSTWSQRGIGSFLGCSERLFKGNWNDDLVSNTSAYKVYFRLQANPKFGALPKAVLFSIFGYIVGRMSYMQGCIRPKLLMLKDSPLAEMIRKEQEKKQGRGRDRFYDSFTPDPSVSTAISLAPFQSSIERFGGDNAQVNRCWHSHFTWPFKNFTLSPN